MRHNRMTKTPLTATFGDDLEDIASTLIKAFGLKYTEEAPGLRSPLYRWLDFVNRYIPARPRKVYFSDRFPKPMDADVEQAYFDILRRIKRGADLNPYQSRGTLSNDTSGRKRQTRTDLLYADWRIHHLHITAEPVPTGEFFRPRSSWLLFAVFGEYFACLIDVRDHNEPSVFSNVELFEILAKNWPEVVEQYEIKGIDVAPRHTSAVDRAELRKAGITTFVQVGGATYMGPGMGVTSAATGARTTFDSMTVNKALRDLARWIEEPNSEFRRQAASFNIAEPKFRLAITPKGLAFYLESADVAFTLPRTPDSLFAKLHDHLLPDWALQQFLARNRCSATPESAL